MSDQFPNLFSPLTIRNVTVKNRIFSSAHGTMIASARVNDELIAYHEARAKGGAGLIIVEVASVHPTSRYSDHLLNAETDACIPGYRRLVDRLKQYDCRVFAQLFHSGREILHSSDGSATAAYAPSAIPNDRFHVMPRTMPIALVGEVVAGYGDAAVRLQRAGVEGVEVVASHGYLPSQFLNPSVNVRTDEYGGSFENRLRFVREVVADIRAKVGDLVIGLRISGTEQDSTGLDDTLVADVCAALDAPEGVDYFSIVTGTSASLGGSVHIAPSMFFGAGYVAPYAAGVKARVARPVFAAGRFNQPQLAEQLIAAGDADMCAMTRALICDPQMPEKARDGRTEDIRACIGCNQACIGHILTGYPVSCIQHPETGRELTYGDKPRRGDRAQGAGRRRRPRRHEGGGGGGGARTPGDPVRAVDAARRPDPARAAVAGARRVRRYRHQLRPRARACRGRGGQGQGGRSCPRRRRGTRHGGARNRGGALPPAFRRRGRGACGRCLAGHQGTGQRRGLGSDRGLALRLGGPRARRAARAGTAAGCVCA